ncbi:MAG: hypothetical protein JJU15_14955 [Pararhodobacter sp.]|nr:hypothetical protein [Pararhodobacter sp.]
MKTQVSVLIRFSYVARNGFRAAMGGVEASRALLYDPPRLARRFALFEALALPALLQQTDPDFTTIFLIGRDFPPEARERLARLTAPLADPRILALPPLPMFQATKQAFQRTRHPERTHLATTRLDDDDALALDVIARLKAMLGPLAAISGDDPVAIAFNNGFFLELGAQENNISQVIERTPASQATTLLVPNEQSETIFSRNHRHLGQFFNLYTDAVTPAFIRSIHRDNDSEPFGSGQVISHDDTTLRALLKGRFAQTLEDLRAIRP